MINKIKSSNKNKSKSPQKKLLSFVLGFYLMIQIADPAKATVNDYVFNSYNGNYSPIVDSILYSGTWDDENSPLLTIPFTFTYNGIDFTTLSISSNGFITLGALTSTVYCGLQASGPNSISAYGTDLMGNPGSTVQFGVRGNQPDREFVLQWTDCAHYQSTVDHYTFQIILHESSNRIEVVYGPFIAQTTMGANNCSATIAESGNVGLKGFNNSDINIRETTNGINNWDSSYAGSSINAVCNLSSGNFPQQGLTYCWTPLTALAMIITSSAATIVDDEKLDMRNSLNNPIVRLQVVTTGNIAPLSIESISFTTAGSSNAAPDISEANIYFTGSNPVFSSANRFGFTASDPDGIRTIDGQTTLLVGNNYFWLAYDIASGATFNDTLKGCILQLQATSTFINQTITANCPAGYHLVGAATLNITVFFDALYKGNNSMIAFVDPINHPLLCDSVTVELHQPSYPYSTIFKNTGTISTSGKGQFVFPDYVLSNNYYIVVCHRNSIETWSKDPVHFSTPTTAFDFTVH